MDRRSFLRTLAPLGAVAVAGCSGDDGTETATETATATPTDSPTPTATPIETETATPTDSPTPTDSATSTSQADLTVVVAPEGNLRFDPAEFTIAVGETVRWEWASAGHNVSPSSQPSGASWPGRDESTYDTGTTHDYTFDVAGTYEYHCDPHQSVGMVGSFTVE